MLLARSVGAVVAAGLFCVAAGARAQTRPALLLADDAHRPHLTVSWPTRSGQMRTLEADKAWRSPADQSVLGGNIEVFAALGGLRSEKGGGDPHGAIVGLTLSKTDWAKPFFEDIADGATVTIRLDHIVMNQPAAAKPKTGLVLLKYRINDLTACELDSTYKNLALTADPDDRLKEVLVPGTCLLGALDGGEGRGRFEAAPAADGSISITLSLPYVQLRHVKDPYQRTTPGGFFEPTSLHVEMELEPKRDE